MNELEMIFLLIKTTEMVAVYEMLCGNMVYGAFIALMEVLIIRHLFGGKPRF